MKSKMMANDLPYLDDHIPNCKACQFGKQNRKPFPKATWRASKKLQLIHLDIASPQGTPSLKGSLYYVVFMDDFTRMCWILFLKHKYEVTQVFWKFKSKLKMRVIVEFKLSYQTIARNTHLNHSIDSARRWAFNINLPLHILRNKMK